MKKKISPIVEFYRKEFPEIKNEEIIRDLEATIEKLKNAKEYKEKAT